MGVLLSVRVLPVVVYATEVSLETEDGTSETMGNKDIAENKDVAIDLNPSENKENDTLVVDESINDETQEKNEKSIEESTDKGEQKDVSGNEISYCAETWESDYKYNEREISQFVYCGNASESEGIINLCNKERQGGIAFIDEKITNMNCIMIEFDIYLGEGKGFGADGISVSFAPSIDTNIPAGDKLGINNGAVGVCYTTHADGISQSIKIVEDSAYTAKQSYKPTTYMDDAKWHTTKILYYNDIMSVIFDNQQILYYTGVREITEGYISIRGTTGARWNTHQIKNVKLYNIIEKNVDVDYSFHDIQVYSEFPNCIIGENQTCAIIPVMADGDNVIEGEEGWNYSIENSNIAEIQEYPKTYYGTAVRIIGKISGDTKLHIVHVPTGKFVDVPIYIVQNSVVYNLSDIAKNTEDIEDTGDTKSAGIMNCGIFTNNYKFTRIDGGYKITFDAYNECASAGAVEVYNSEDQLIEAYEIKKFEAYQTGIKEVAMDGWNLVTSGFDGSITSITNSMYTKKTPITIESVPDGGYIVITNDITTSLPAALYNLVDLASWLYKEVGILNDWKGKEAFEDKAKINITRELINAFIGLGYDKSAIAQFTDKLTKSMSKELSINSKDMADMAVSLLNDADIVLKEKNINLGEEIRDAAIDTGIDVAMDIFNKFSPTGNIIQGIFDTNNTLNGFMQIVHINKTEGGRKVRVDINGGKDKLVSEGVIVEKSDGTIFVDTELIVVDITEEDTSKYIIQNFNSVSQIKIYNITLYRDNSEIQPNGKIRIRIPLPALYNKDKCAIYRIETNNSLTDMNAKYVDGYMVFETDHLSKYVLYEKFSYSVVFDGNGASSGNMSVLSDCLKDTEYNLPTNTYIKRNYLFNGWNTLQDGTGTSFSDGNPIINLTATNNETVTLYAQWKFIGTETGVSDSESVGTNNNLGTGDKTGSINDKGSSSGKNNKTDMGIDHNELIDFTDTNIALGENKLKDGVINTDKSTRKEIDMPKTGDDSPDNKMYFILLLLIGMFCFITFVPYNRQKK